MIVDETTIEVKTNMFVEAQTVPHPLGVFIAFESRINEDKYMQPWPVLVRNDHGKEFEIKEFKKMFEDDCIRQYLKHGRHLPGLS